MKQPERGRIVAGKYALEKPIGQGAMGEVWVVRHVHNGRRFAMKLLKNAVVESAEMRGRFEREAKLAAGLVSPYIAQVTDSGRDEEGDPYTVLELLEGEDLQKRLKKVGRLPLATVTRIANQVGKALRVAHAAGLVHRDLKPANIFLAKQDDEENVKVLDFGIAKSSVADQTEYTATGAMLGTASYMSPEHVRSAKTVDHRADLWAFAVVLYRALTGDLPFSVTGFELFVALNKDPIPAPNKATSHVQGLPPAVDVFFERAFAQDIQRRYPTAAALVEGFCRAVGAPVPASEPLQATAALPANASPAPAGVTPLAAADASKASVHHSLGGTIKLDDRGLQDLAQQAGSVKTPRPPSVRALASTVLDTGAPARAREPASPRTLVLALVAAALVAGIVAAALLLTR